MDKLSDENLQILHVVICSAETTINPLSRENKQIVVDVALRLSNVKKSLNDFTWAICNAEPQVQTEYGLIKSRY